MLTAATVFGTRPEAIKLAPVVKAIEAATELRQLVIVTAQHRQMLDQVLALFEIAPDHDLDLMTPDQSLASLTARAIERLTALFGSVRPDIVVVQGDTTTTFCAALAAYYNRIPVAHVEAGLRTFQRYSPWPEEVNRQLTGRLAELHFPPTIRSRENLLREGVAPDSIEVTGNTVIDAVLWVQARIEREKAANRLDIQSLLAANAVGEPIGQHTLSALNAVERGERRLILVTGHRRESFGAGFQRICQALANVARRYPGAELIYPVHLNPNVRQPVHATLGELPNVHLLPPLDYLPFVYLMRLSYLIVTDSGGIQEEAPSLGKPVLVMRDTTERPEGVDAGTVALVGTSVERIVSGVTHLLEDQGHYQRMATAVNPYGDGRASGRIVARVVRFLAEQRQAVAP